jgi:hypothetical protein
VLRWWSVPSDLSPSPSSPRYHFQERTGPRPGSVLFSLARARGWGRRCVADPDAHLWRGPAILAPGDGRRTRPALRAVGSPEVPRWFPDSGAPDTADVSGHGAQLAARAGLAAALILVDPDFRGEPGNFGRGMLELCFRPLRCGSDHGRRGGGQSRSCHLAPGVRGQGRLEAAPEPARALPRGPGTVARSEVRRPNPYAVGPESRVVLSAEPAGAAAAGRDSSVRSRGPHLQVQGKSQKRARQTDVEA